MNPFSPIISDRLHIPASQVQATLALLEAGCTIPFISRYRKEATGNLNEVQITAIDDLATQLDEVQKRKETILKTIEAQGKLTDELRRRIEASWDATELEDLYMPYKPRRRTRAQVAREQGLEPLATLLLLQREQSPSTAARRFINADVPDTAAALHGAQDIIAENISEDERSRQLVRQAFARQAVITARVIEKKRHDDGAQKFADYFSFSEDLRRCSSHRLLAMRRGEQEGYLRVAITIDDDACISRLQRLHVHGTGPCQKWVNEAVADAYSRLLRPSIENEFAAQSKTKADSEAIDVFQNNLRQLLLAPPLGPKRVMGVDPGIRTGCKVVIVDAQGTLVAHDVVFATGRQAEPRHTGQPSALDRFTNLARRYHVEAIACGNGTASRETADILRQIPDIPVYIVSEDGASIYSASDIAREEFPNEDVTVRGAVSIARRLIDPMAELVKIDPKSIGVGQYQHDVDQTRLRQRLDQTVELCVNAVGADLNTASVNLLRQRCRKSPCTQHRSVPNRKRFLHIALTIKESSPPRCRSIQTVCRFPAPAPRTQSVRRHGRTSRKLRHRRAHGSRLRVHHIAAYRQSRQAQPYRHQPVCNAHNGPAHAERHHGRTGKTRSRPARTGRNLQL